MKIIIVKAQREALSMEIISRSINLHHIPFGQLWELEGKTHLRELPLLYEETPRISRKTSATKRSTSRPDKTLHEYTPPLDPRKFRWGIWRELPQCSLPPMPPFLEDHTSTEATQRQKRLRKFSSSTTIIVKANYCRHRFSTLPPVSSSK